jgi:hypothetical protein
MSKSELFRLKIQQGEKINTDSAFELLAEKHNLDLTRIDYNYTNPKTILAYNFWMARQCEITALKNDVEHWKIARESAMSAAGFMQAKIERLEHDLASEKCACNIFQHLAGKEMDKEMQE